MKATFFCITLTFILFLCGYAIVQTWPYAKVQQEIPIPIVVANKVISQPEHKSFSLKQIEDAKDAEYKAFSEKIKKQLLAIKENPPVHYNAGDFTWKESDWKTWNKKHSNDKSSGGLSMYGPGLRGYPYGQYTLEIGDSLFYIPSIDE